MTGPRGGLRNINYTGQRKKRNYYVENYICRERCTKYQSFFLILLGHNLAKEPSVINKCYTIEADPKSYRRAGLVHGGFNLQGDHHVATKAPLTSLEWTQEPCHATRSTFTRTTPPPWTLASSLGRYVILTNLEKEVPLMKWKVIIIHL